MSDGDEDEKDFDVDMYISPDAKEISLSVKGVEPIEVSDFVAVVRDICDKLEEGERDFWDEDEVSLH
jgi:hypothetical protein